MNELIFEYKFDNQNLKNLKSRILEHLIVSEWKNDFELMKKLLKYTFFELYQKNNEEYIFEKFNALFLLDYAKKNNHKNRFTCWHFAVFLTELLLSFGIKAKMIRCIGNYKEFEFNDCHCVVHAYSEFFKKWVLLDPANSSIYYDDRKVPLSLNELRETITKNKRIFLLNADKEFIQGLIKYWKKNLYRFQCDLVNEYGLEDSVKHRTIINLIPESEEYKNFSYINNGKQLDYVYITNSDLFWNN